MKTSLLSSKNIRLTLLALTWMTPFASSVLFLLYTKVVYLDGQLKCRHLRGKSLSTVFNGFGFVIFNMAPLIAMMTLYTHTIKALRERPISSKDSTKENKAGRPFHVSGNITGSRQSNIKESVEFR